MVLSVPITAPALDSSISATQYGYDLVVAQKQSSINTNLQHMLYSSTWLDVAPVNNICYGIDKSSNLFELDYDTLVASGVDPFSIPNDTKLDDERIKRLQSFNFLIAFRAQIGIPRTAIQNRKLPQVPDIVVLNGDVDDIEFRILCSQFQVVGLRGGIYSPTSWFSQAQSDKEVDGFMEPSNLWVFRTKVNLRLWSTPNSAYANLPIKVQARLQNNGYMFSLQRLFYNLCTPGLMSTPEIFQGSIPSELEHIFCSTYLSTARRLGKPLLECPILEPRAAAPSGRPFIQPGLFNYVVCPYLDSSGYPIRSPTPAQLGAATLSYVCLPETNHSTKVMPPFGWNWMDPDSPTKGSPPHGVMAVGRAYLTQHLRSYFDNTIPQSCLAISAKWSQAIQGSVKRKKAFENINWEATATEGHQPRVETPSSGATILRYLHDTYHEQNAYIPGNNYKQAGVKFWTNFQLDVRCEGRSITVWQAFSSSLNLCGYITQDWEIGGRVVDKEYADVYSLDVTPNGAITVSEPLKTISREAAAFTRSDSDVEGFDSKWNDLSTFIQGLPPLKKKDRPLNTFLDNKLLPGGRALESETVAIPKGQLAMFSKNGDLIVTSNFASTSG